MVRRLLVSASLFVLLLSLLSLPALAADWSLSTVKGGDFKLSENTGHPLLLIYWATWCEPCKKELNEHKATFESYEQQGVKVVLISVDTQKSQSRIKPFIDSRGFTWPVLLDPGQETLKRYGGNHVPYTVLLNKNGEPAMKINSGLKDTSELSSKINELLAAK